MLCVAHELVIVADVLVIHPIATAVTSPAVGQGHPVGRQWHQTFSFHCTLGQEETLPRANWKFPERTLELTGRVHLPDHSHLSRLHLPFWLLSFEVENGPSVGNERSSPQGSNPGPRPHPKDKSIQKPQNEKLGSAPHSHFTWLWSCTNMLCPRGAVLSVFNKFSQI